MVYGMSSFQPKCGCKVSGIVVGEGFRFGYKAAGDTQMLQELGAAHSVNVSVVSLVSSACTEGAETVRHIYITALPQCLACAAPNSPSRRELFKMSIE